MTITNYSMFSIPKRTYSITLKLLGELGSMSFPTSDRISDGDYYENGYSRAGNPRPRESSCVEHLPMFLGYVSISVIIIAFSLVFAAAAFIIFAIPDGIKYLSKPDEVNIETEAMTAQQ